MIIALFKELLSLTVNKSTHFLNIYNYNRDRENPNVKYVFNNSDTKYYTWIFRICYITLLMSGKDLS